MLDIYDFSEFPILHTKRLLLRQLNHEDAAGLIELFSSPEVLRFLSQEPTDSPEKAIGLIDWFNGMFTSHEALQWAICLAETGEFVGTGGNIGWDKENRQLDIGYHILPRCWGKGYATEAAHAIIEWSFINLNLHRINSDCTEGNIASERVMLKAGFQPEGIMREAAWEHGRFVNIKRFGLLRREYFPNE